MKVFIKFLLMLSLILVLILACDDTTKPSDLPDDNGGSFNTTEGGILKISNGAEITVPAGAISNQIDGTPGEVTFTIEANVASKDLPIQIPTDFKVFGSIFKFGPLDFIFDGPVQIFLPASSVSSPQDMEIAWYNKTKNEWILLPINTIDSKLKRLGASVFELGYFAVVSLSKTSIINKGTPEIQSPEPEPTWLRVGGIRMHHNMMDYFVTMTVKAVILKYPTIPWPDPVGDAATNGSYPAGGPLPTTYLGNIPQGIYEIVISRSKRGTLFELPGKTETYTVPIYVNVTPFILVEGTWDEWDWLGWVDLVVSGGEWRVGSPEEWPDPTIPEN